MGIFKTTDSSDTNLVTPSSLYHDEHIVKLLNSHTYYSNEHLSLRMSLSHTWCLLPEKDLSHINKILLHIPKLEKHTLLKVISLSYFYEVKEKILVHFITMQKFPSMLRSHA